VLDRFGILKSINTDQRSQFTPLEFAQTLKDVGVAISMDGKGRWMDNVFIERLWRSMKWERFYLRELETGSQARAALIIGRTQPLTDRGQGTYIGKGRHPGRRHELNRPLA
jgi:transposase InsO family protein